MVQSLSVVYSGLGDIVQCISNICFTSPLCLGCYWMQMLIHMASFYLQISQMNIPEFSYIGGLTIQRLSLCSYRLVLARSGYPEVKFNLIRLAVCAWWNLFSRTVLNSFLCLLPSQVFHISCQFPSQVFFFSFSNFLPIFLLICFLLVT